MACSLEDVFNLLLSGEKIKADGWASNEFIHIVNCDIVDQDGNSYVFKISGPDASEWNTFVASIDIGYYHRDSNYTLVYYDGSGFQAYISGSWQSYEVLDEGIFLTEHTLILESPLRDRQIINTVVDIEEV